MKKPHLVPVIGFFAAIAGTLLATLLVCAAPATASAKTQSPQAASQPSPAVVQATTVIDQGH